MNTAVKYPAEVRERAVRMVLKHQDSDGSQWAAVASIAAKIGCTVETLCRWVSQSERASGRRAGLTTEGRRLLKAMEHEHY
ncbi:hypothetical protein DEM34_18205 [Spiribacter halobius]|uniref:IS3 family transposase n=1 Tax=Sediminicurvatus halobius TaxID=2182432 RepID=A0A2U2MWA3_9GAMM|nr:hypothetical protein DEM34_18205 [Spiribacter halobius]